MNSFKFNRSDYRFIFIYFVVAFFWLTYRWGVENYSNYEILTGLPGFVIKNVLLLYIFQWLINRYLVVKRNYVMFFILAFLAWEVVGFLDMLRDYYTADPSWEIPSIGTILVQNFYRASFDSVMLIGLILGKKYYENKLDFVQLQTAQKEMELKFLRSQFDPHFLYNSLNTIDSLIDYSPREKVKEYISHLASLYRYLIHTKDQDIVTLENEIELAKNYFYLIETRFGNDYGFKLVERVGQGLNYLPNGALLTVLENVVKHNKASEEQSILTEIRIDNDYVKVMNTKELQMTKKSTSGTGLNNLDKRYRLLSDKKIEIEETKAEFIVRLPLLQVID